MKYFYMRIVSLLTAIVLLVPVVGQCPAMNIFIAHADDIESLNSDDEDIYAAQYEALNMAVLSRAGNWSQAHYKDGLPWNYFHNQVQNHIRLMDTTMNQKELTVHYYQGKKLKTGRADLK